MKPGEHLLQVKERIIQLWEQEVRRYCPAAKDKGKIALRDDLPDFLQELGVLLDTNPEQIKDKTCLSEPAKEHGKQRAYLPDYSLVQILSEYSILRRITLQVMQERNNVSPEIRALINEHIDQAMVISADQFSKIRDGQIHELMDNLHRSNRDLEHFASIAAHDLRSPAATISGYVSLLDELIVEKSPDVKVSLDFIAAASRRMMTLIEKLLDYAQLRKSALIAQEVDLNNVVADTLANLEALIEETGAQIFYRQLPKINGDPALLTQLFQNLISNSIKFRDSRNPVIRISLAKEDDEGWTIAVKDNGIGFDAQHSEKIFEPFQRLHSNDQYQGSGLGLATCRRVAELHGGKMWATSVVGEGSTFNIFIPKRD